MTGRRVLGRKSFKAAAGKGTKVVVRLGATARRTLKERRTLRVKARIAVEDVAGTTTKRTVAFTLEAPKAR